MANKNTAVTRNSTTGSYTVRVTKSASTGQFASGSKPTGRIVVRESGKKAS